RPNPNCSRAISINRTATTNHGRRRLACPRCPALGENPMKTIANFIDGKMLAPVGGEYLDDVNPATKETVAKIPRSDERDVELAIAAAKEAFKSWSKTPVSERVAWLRKFSHAIAERADELALA